MKPNLAEAMKILDEADPEEKARIERYLVVKGQNLLGQRATPEPSFGAQDPRNAELVARQQRAHEQAQKAELAAQERSAARINAELEDLAAAQAPDNRAAILRQRQ